MNARPSVKRLNVEVGGAGVSINDDINWKMSLEVYRKPSVWIWRNSSEDEENETGLCKKGCSWKLCLKLAIVVSFFLKETF